MHIVIEIGFRINDVSYPARNEPVEVPEEIGRIAIANKYAYQAKVEKPKKVKGK